MQRGLLVQLRHNVVTAKLTRASDVPPFILARDAVLDERAVVNLMKECMGAGVVSGGSVHCYGVDLIAL
jgi:hypothetical protein